MNKIDKIWYKSLKFWSTYSTKEINEIKKQHLSHYQEKVPEDVENTFHQFGYIQFRPQITRIVTQGGLQQLRDLENIRRNDITLIIAIVAFLVSLSTLIISLKNIP